MRLTLPNGTRFRPKQFEVTDLGVQPVLWYDASDESTVTLNGNTVSQIDDKSGNGLHMIQPIASTQPYYISEELFPSSTEPFNYRNVLNFINGSSMETNGFIDAISPTTECTIFLVSQNDNVNLKNSVFQTVPDPPENRISSHAPWGSGDIFWDYGNINGSGRISTSYTGGSTFNTYCYYSSITNSKQKVLQNNIQIMSDNDANTFVPNSHLMRIGNVFTGVIGEFVMFDQALIDYQIDQINRQLITKWTGV